MKPSEQKTAKWRRIGAQPPMSSNIRVHAYVGGQGSSLKPHKRIFRESAVLDSKPNEPDTSRHSRFHPGDDMTTQDRYIDARLAGIESKLDARMDAMQRFQEQAETRFREAEGRFERVSDRQSAEISLLSQKFDTRFDETRRHTTTVAIGVFAIIAIIAGLSWYWISEQGSYAKSYGENQVQMQQAADERAEFREAVKSIQATQQSILDRLPTEQTNSLQQ